MAESVAEKVEVSPLNVDQEIDLLEYLNAILRAKFRILIVSILVAGAVFGYSKTIEDKFRSTALVAINVTEGFGGTKPGQYRGSDIVGLLEYSFMVDEPADNEKDRIMARLGSSTFIELFISEQNLLPYIFKESWNAATNSWMEGFVPSMPVAVGIFRESMLHASIDTLSGLLPISITTNDRELSSKLANIYYKRFNEYVRDKRLYELAEQRELLNARLDATTNIEMQRSIFRMLETQLAEEILLNAKDNYPLELIQAAQVPLFKSSPNRKLWTILAFILTAVVSISFCIGLIILKKLRLALAGYDAHPKASVKEEVAEPQSSFTNADTIAPAKNERPQDTRRATVSSAEPDELSDWLD